MKYFCPRCQVELFVVENKEMDCNVQCLTCPAEIQIWSGRLISIWFNIEINENLAYRVGIEFNDGKTWIYKRSKNNTTYWKWDPKTISFKGGIIKPTITADKLKMLLALI